VRDRRSVSQSEITMDYYNDLDSNIAMLMYNI